MVLQIKNLTHIYAQGTAFEKVAVDNLSMEINKGEFVGIIGHTGSGKSTLIQHLNSLLKPTSGQILLNGEDINIDKKKLKSIRQRVGLIFQYPEYQLFEMTVYKDVAYAPTMLKLDKEEIDIRVKNALNLVGISEDLYEKSPLDLSGGQKRRVAIAGVLAMQPEVLVMDEPMAGLDPKGRNNILDNIKDMHNKIGNTIIIVSHSMEDIAKFCDKIFVLDGGKLKFSGTPREVFKNAYELEEIGLAAPKMSYLVKALNKKGFGIKDDLYTVEEVAEAIKQIL